MALHGRVGREIVEMAVVGEPGGVPKVLPLRPPGVTEPVA